jgi:hypothetical protein
MCLAAGLNLDRLGFAIPARRRVLICQFELPLPHFLNRLRVMRQGLGLGAEADHQLLIDTRAAGHLLSAPQGLAHFLGAAQAAAAEVLILDPLYSTHDQDENDTRAMAALCQGLLHLRDASGAALVVVHHARKSVNRHEVGSAFRGSSALHAVGDSYLLLTRCSAEESTLEMRFQFRYAESPPPRRLELDKSTLWFSAASPTPAQAPGRKVEMTDISQVLQSRGQPLRYSQLREEIMQRTRCSKRTAQLAISKATQQGILLPKDGHYRLSGVGEAMLPSPAGGTRRPGETEASSAGMQLAEG